MPKALIPLSASYTSVSRRVAVNVVQYLTELMRLPESTKVFLPGQPQAIPLNDAEFGVSCSDNQNYPGDSYIKLTFIEEAEEEHTFTTSVMDKQNRPIFHDEQHNVEIRPVYRYVKMTCNIEFISASHTQAVRWLDDQRAMFSAGRAENEMSLEYYFQVPEGMVLVLKALHDALMKSHWPIQDPFEHWVLGHIKNGAYPKGLTTLAGTHPTLAIAEKQEDVLGWFDWTTTPETPERNDDGSGTYRVNFNYQIGYARPTHVHIDYPMIMRQRPISKLYWAKEPYTYVKGSKRKVSITKEAFDELRFMEDNLGSFPYVQYPNIDDWYPTNTFNRRGLMTIYTGLIMLGKDDQQTLMDLSNLGSCRFTPHFLEYFYTQGNAALSSLTSIFELTLYRNHTRLDGLEFTFIPGTLKVQVSEPLDPTYMYHIQISIKRNPVRTSVEVRDTLKYYPTVAWTIFRVLGVYLGGAKSIAELDLVGKNIPRLNNPPQYGEGYILNGVLPDTVNWGLTDDTKIIDKGFVKTQDISEAVRGIELTHDLPINRITIGPLNVLYNDILTFKK